ncbi:DUF6318 family protein [Pimelobacter simplex]|uniref:DUF6318 family protein n=1 Tax=Nocardioides simplex TaxID=2045 RepID=UPI00366C9313
MGRLRWSWWVGRARARWRACVVALAVVLAGGGFSGCDGGSASPSPPVRSPEVSVSGSPTGAGEPSPALMVPVLPGAAKEASEDGARAFVGYYWELVNYAQATGDVRRLRRVSAPTCEVCSGFVRDIRDHYRAGGRIVGGGNSVAITESAELSTAAGEAYGFRIELDLTHDEQSIIDGDGATSNPPSGVDQFTAYVLWVDGNHWRLDALDLK